MPRRELGGITVGVERGGSGALIPLDMAQKMSYKEQRGKKAVLHLKLG